jgi:hypothetical protein
MNESQRSESHQSIAHLSNSREETGGETVCAVPGKVAGWHVQTQDLEASYVGSGAGAGRYSAPHH